MGLGFWELAVILLIILGLFGAGKLPRVMGDVGKGVKALKDGLKDGDSAQTKSPSESDKPKL